MPELNDIDVPDMQLVALVRKGDMNAYEVLVKRYHQKVFGLAMSMVQNEADAMDISQETFIRGWKSMSRFEGKSSLYTWLYRITANLAVDVIRRRQSKGTVPFEEWLPGEDAGDETGKLMENQELPDETLSRKELAGAIKESLAKLSPEHRAVLVLKEFEDLDYKEIADVIGCSIGTVMSRLFYARRNMRKYLKGWI